MGFKTEKKEDCCAIKSPRFGKLDMGVFARNKQREFALVGGDDEAIQSLALTIAQKIPPQYRVGFAHILSENTRNRGIFNVEYTQKSGLHHVVLDGQKGVNQYRDMFSDVDIVVYAVLSACLAMLDKEKLFKSLVSAFGKAFPDKIL